MKSTRRSVSIPAGARNDPFEPACQWEAADGAQRAIANPPLIRDLRHAAIRGLLSIPRRGVEIGGLLLGSVRREGLGRGRSTVIEITASESVPCEHRFGPAYVLDPMDEANLARVLARHEADDGPHVVGFYRSYTGREAQLDEVDHQLLASFFSQHRDFVCLLLQPLSSEKCTADIEFLREDETVEAPPGEPLPYAPAEDLEETAEMPHAAVLLEPPPEIPSKKYSAAPLLPVPAHRRFVEEDPEPVPQAKPRSGILLAAVLFVLAALGGGTVYEWQKGESEQTGESAMSSPRIHFDAQPSAGALLLQWDTANPAVSRATRGVLAVTEGGSTREIPLNQSEARRGSFAYEGWNGESLFQLRLYDQDRAVVAESLRVIKPAAPVDASPAPAGPVEAATVAPEKSSTPVEPQLVRAIKPPAVRREVRPVISPGIRARISSPTVVQVQVDVNESGRVTQASSDVAGHGLQRYLADEAVKAARQWSFFPARSKEGSPVAGSTTVSFEFTPETR